MSNGTNRPVHGDEINPRASGARKTWGRTWAMGSLLALCSLAAQAQTVTVNSISTRGCNAADFGFNVTFAGLAAPTGPWQFHTVVQQGAAVYMNELFTSNASNGAGNWWVLAQSTGGPTTPFPMPDNVPFTMTISILNAAGQTVSTTQTTVDRCGTGAQITSNATTMVPLPTPTAVPTLEAGGLAALAGALGVVGWLRRRRMA